MFAHVIPNYYFQLLNSWTTGLIWISCIWGGRTFKLCFLCRSATSWGSQDAFALKKRIKQIRTQFTWSHESNFNETFVKKSPILKSRQSNCMWICNVVLFDSDFVSSVKCSISSPKREITDCATWLFLLYILGELQTDSNSYVYISFLLQRPRDKFETVTQFEKNAEGKNSEFVVSYHEMLKRILRLR